MIGTILIAVILLGAAAVLAVRAVSLPRARAKGQLAQIDAYGFSGGTAGKAAVADPTSLFAGAGAALGKRVGRDGLSKQRKLLLSAGLYKITAEQFLVYRVISLIGVPLMMLYVATSTDLAVPLQVVAIACGVLMGWRAPGIILERRAKQRLHTIDRAMPELVDLLVVGVESGMGFGGAVRAASARVAGPLGDELLLMLREQGLGVDTSDALRNMLERADTPATRSFTRTIIQGERLGVSIGHLMRSLADEMRKRRKALAEEHAHKAPIKILFPLVFLIFPAIFVVILGPAAINVFDMFGNS